MGLTPGRAQNHADCRQILARPPSSILLLVIDWSIQAELAWIEFTQIAFVSSFVSSLLSLLFFPRCDVDRHPIGPFGFLYIRHRSFLLPCLLQRCCLCQGCCALY